nr:hypothetical protein [Rhodanobacter glycinis]
MNELLGTSPNIGRLCLAVAKEVQIARIDDWQKNIPKNDWELVDVQTVQQLKDATPEAEMPKKRRNNKLLAALGVKPLNEEA